jgi:hypothetical protein
MAQQMARSMASWVAPEAARSSVAVRVRGVLGTALLVLPAVLAFLCLMTVIGAWRDDVAISSHTGKATAEVVSVSFGRTIIRFTTPDGEVHSPPSGVLYPGGLEPGQLVRIEYDVRNPDLARVVDRDVSTGILPALLTAVGGWLVFAPLGLWLRRRAHAVPSPSACPHIRTHEFGLSAHSATGFKRRTRPTGAANTPSRSGEHAHEPSVSQQFPTVSRRRSQHGPYR